jgi:hypothetical protein
VKYALYNKSDGHVLGHGSAPDGYDLAQLEDAETGVIEVSEEPDPHTKVVEGSIVPMMPEEIEQVKFPSIKMQAPARVRQIVSSARQTYITELPGQDALYQAKETEAKAFLAEANPVMADYPLLSAETGITAPTAAELANLWISMGMQWRSVAAQIEAARMTANTAIGAATTVLEIEAALAALDTAIAGLPTP